MPVVQVVVPGRKLDRLDYLPLDIPFPLERGMRVMVELRHKPTVGVVWGAKQHSTLDVSRLKRVLALMDETPLLTSHWCDMADWIADYYQVTRGEVLKAFLPTAFRSGRSPLHKWQTHHYSLETEQYPSGLGKRQRELLACLQEHPGVTITELKQQGFSPQILNTLRELKLLGTAYLPLPPPDSGMSPELPPSLTAMQQQAVEALVAAQGFAPFLLMGVTGSGKTEVYFRAMTAVLQKGQSVLVLVPEIGLTPQFLNRLQRRFAVPIVEWHSSLTPSQRQQHWAWAQQGQARIVLGTRSAVMTPLPNLGLIVVDEEHDLSYKQQDGIRFSARDVAVKRAQHWQIPIILGSATPSLETYYHAQRGHYQHLSLPSKALAQHRNHYSWIDLRALGLQEGMASSSLHQMATALADNQQILVYLNRRGYAPVWICHHCGWMADCQHCSAHLTVHRGASRLRCHHCGFEQQLVHRCGQCGQSEMIPLGLGTERISQFLSEYFPKHQVLRVDSDTTTTKAKLNRHLAMIDAGEVDIIVGTQMLAKGHHFSRLGMVVIADGDAGLSCQDFRAPERFAQTLLQVAGRAGREMAGRVLVQTHHPGHPLLQKLIEAGYGAVADDLLSQRQHFHWPPYVYLVLCRVKARHAQTAEALLLALLGQWQPESSVECLGPVPTTMAQKADWYEMQLLLRSPQRKALHVAMAQGRLRLAQLAKQKQFRAVVVQWDRDPQQF